jgi:hypothetical protein
MPSAHADSKLVVHEWGTVTFLQDETGKPIGGINIAGEPVPEFLHETAPGLLLASDPDVEMRGPARCNLDVTMTIDSSVLQFYPEEGFDVPFDVAVEFFGSGMFTHYFPSAAVTPAPGSNQYLDGFSLFEDRGELRWNEVRVKAAVDSSTVGAPAWLASSVSDAATVEVNGDRAKFLSYRAIGNRLTEQLKVSRAGPELVVTSGRDASHIDQLWLADVRADGRVAFRVLRPFEKETAFLVRTGHEFAPEDYSGDNASALRAALVEAVIAAGLFEAEAEALLDSAQTAYFTSRGLRLFYLTPGNSAHVQIRTRRPWAPCCPDQAAGPRPPRPPEPQVTGVTLTRIELVSPSQRALLARIAGSDSALGTGGIEASQLPQTDDEWNELYQLYVQLGTFRNPLVLDEQKRRPTPRLNAFIEHFRLEAQPTVSPFERPRRSQRARPRN